MNSTLKVPSDVVSCFQAVISLAFDSGMNVFEIDAQASPDETLKIEKQCLKILRKRVTLIKWVANQTLVYINKLDDAACEEIALTRLLQAFYSNHRNVQLDFCLPQANWKALLSKLSFQTGCTVQFVNQDQKGTCLWITQTHEQIQASRRGTKDSLRGVADPDGIRWDADSAEDAYYISIGRHDLVPGCLPSANR